MEARMAARLVCAGLGVTLVGAGVVTQGRKAAHLNPLIELHQQGKPVFGLYAPTNRRAGGRGRGTVEPAIQLPPPPQKSPAELAKDALAYEPNDFLFTGTMEPGVDPAVGPFTAFVDALMDAAPPAARWKHPLVVKTPKIGTDPAKAVQNISRQLNTGASTIVFVETESAAEVQQGLAAMRFVSKGGTRPEVVGSAPKYWGMTEMEYRQKADLWPLNSDGELTNWTIVESRVGLTRVREIAAVKGISVLFPGAGTLRGVFSTTGADGTRVVDAEGWEAAIQQVLAACKEFNVPCGYPATANDIEMRMKQGFSVFVINWGEPGFRTIDIGRRVAGR
jgi:4-hydroxy-2-oxoheptanedioate aldolase